ncbi:MAG TPA: hypothetical protein DCX95_01555 [Elusimicrobia bacterium]|nr:hypothetical protein [Elusimicrobiota bacterium]
MGTEISPQKKCEHSHRGKLYEIILELSRNILTFYFLPFPMRSEARNFSRPLRSDRVSRAPAGSPFRDEADRVVGAACLENLLASDFYKISIASP